MVKDCVWTRSWTRSWTRAWPGRSGLAGVVLGSESQLGAGPLALQLGVDGSEGQVDAWASVVVLLGHLVLEDTHTRPSRSELQASLVRGHVTGGSVPGLQLSCV